MKSRLVLTSVLAFVAVALPARADQLPPFEAEGFTQTKAKSFDDFAGRAVLIEFFAYW